MNLVGSKLGKYELVEHIGKGGMAQVYKAFQPGVERFVAVKVMHKYLAEDESFVARFRREAKAIGRMRHEHIVGFIDFDLDDDQYYLVMNYIKGDTLRDYLKKNGPLPPVQALRIVAKLALALAYAHQHGIIHRDIKPGNIMFMDDSLSRPLLTDFGIARLAGHKQTTVSNSIVGTPAYMSPEALQHETIDERSDIYSLGVVLYQMVVGTTPYSANTPYGMILKRLNDPLPLPCQRNSHIPKEVEQLILNALAEKSTQRFQSAEKFYHAIEHTLATLTGQQPTPSIASKPSSLSANLSERLASLAKRKAHRAIVSPAKRNSSHFRVNLLTLLRASGGLFATAALSAMLFFGWGSPTAPSETEAIANLASNPTAIAVATATAIPSPTIAPTELVASNSTNQAKNVTEPPQATPPTDLIHEEESHNFLPESPESHLGHQDEQQNQDEQSSEDEKWADDQELSGQDEELGDDDEEWGDDDEESSGKDEESAYADEVWGHEDEELSDKDQEWSHDGQNQEPAQPVNTSNQLRNDEEWSDDSQNEEPAQPINTSNQFGNDDEQHERAEEGHRRDNQKQGRGHRDEKRPPKQRP